MFGVRQMASQISGTGATSIQFAMPQVPLSGSRLLGFIGIVGPGQGGNSMLDNQSNTYVEIAGHNQASPALSIDTMHIISAPSGLPNPYLVTASCSVASVIAAAVLELTNADNSSYGFMGHAYDNTAGYAGTSNATATGRFPAAGTTNFAWEDIFFAYVSDQANTVSSISPAGFSTVLAINGSGVSFGIMGLVQTVTGQFWNPTFNLNSAANWEATGLGLKVLSIPPSGVAGFRSLLGVGV